MISVLNCLFCQKSVIDIDNVSSKDEDTNEQVAQVLTEVFATLCNLLQLEFTRPENIWDFKETPFPFCTLCRNDIARLFKLREEISEIEKNIQQILIKFSTLTLESYGRARVHNPGEKMADSLKNCVADKNNNYENLRQQIIKRYCPCINLEKCKSGATAADSEPFAVCEYEQHEDQILDYENGSKAMKMKEEDALDVEVQESSSSNICPKTPRIANSFAENSSLAKKRRNSTSCSNYRVVLIEGTTTFLYRNTRLTIVNGKITCLECGFKTTLSPGEDIHFNIKKHVRMWHTGRTGKKFVVTDKTELVDKATKTYSIQGFQFTSTNEGHLCLTCGKISKIRRYKKKVSKFLNIRAHITNVHHRETTEKECQVCKDGILRKHLPSHMSRNHPKDSTPRVCHVCNKVFKNKAHLSGHMICHKDKDISNYKYQCDRCGKKCVTKYHLDSHVMMHTGEKPFVCEKCGRRFSHIHLNTHLPTHEIIRPFACKQCDWSFGANFLLTRHIKQVHEGIKPPPPKKRKKLTKLSSKSFEGSCGNALLKSD